MTAKRRPEPERGTAQQDARSSLAGAPRTLAAWLAYLETLHPKAIALGLERVRGVLARLPVRLDAPVITVGGTNGKGSTCAMLETMLRCAGYRTALYSSPHIARYNERVRLDGVEVDDATLLAAFEAVEAARAPAGEEAIPLTYFEFGTLAALLIFAQARPDAIVLEVGLGGRLDAVNVIDADVAVLTAIDIDHVEYLGPDRAAIAREKAGILRGGRPAVCGDADPPATLLAEAQRCGADLQVLGRDFGYERQASQWRYWSRAGERFGLPVPALRGSYQLGNASTAIAALECLATRVPVHAAAVRDGLARVELPGRFQVLPGRPTIVLDVAHNPQAARSLADTLATMGFHPQTFAVLGMLRDKDVHGVLQAMLPRVDRWFVAPLPGPRGADASTLRAQLVASGVKPACIIECADVDEALRRARGEASEADRIVVFGSFLTVAAALVATADPSADRTATATTIRNPNHSRHG